MSSLITMKCNKIYSSSIGRRGTFIAMCALQDEFYFVSVHGEHTSELVDNPVRIY